MVRFIIAAGVLAGSALAHVDAIGPSGRNDASVTLIEIAAHVSAFREVFSEASTPSRCDYEELNEHSTKLWANAEQLVELVVADVDFKLTEDTGTCAKITIDGAEMNYSTNLPQQADTPSTHVSLPQARSTLPLRRPRPTATL